MLRRSALIVVLAIVVPGASVRGQSAPSIGHDLTQVCEALEAGHGPELMLTGRAQPPVTVRISGEAEIEQARVNLVRVEAEVQRLRESLDPQTVLEREREFAIKLGDARDHLWRQQGSHPPPMTLTLIPVQVEQVFRGVTAPILMVWPQPPLTTLEPGVLYLMAGDRHNALKVTSGIDIVTVMTATDAESVAPALRFLTSNRSSAAIFGRLQMHSYGGPRAPLGDVRIRVSSGQRVVETVTGNDGSFFVSGLLFFGRVEVRPLLPKDLTVVNKSASTIEIREGGCKTVYLTAALNGRLRGRILGVSGTSLDGVQLVLQGVDSSGRSGSHQPRTSVRPNGDGTFEFSGQIPGSYVLSAWVVRVENGKKRHLTTYFPGTPDRSAAVPIVIGKATQHAGFDFLVITE